MADSVRELASRGFHERRKAIRGQVAEGLKPAPHTDPVSDETARRLFWQRDPNVNEADLWEATLIAAYGTPEGRMLSPEDIYQRAAPNIIQALYPKRREVVEAGERRIDMDKRRQFSDRMAALGPPDDEEMMP